MSVPITIHGARFKGTGFDGPSVIHVGPSYQPVTNVTDVVVVSDKIITCTLPPRDPSWARRVNIYITTPYGTGVRIAVFRYHPAILEVTSVDPPYGLYTGGEPLVITGKNFLGSGIDPALSVRLLHFSDVYECTDFEVISDTEIHVNTPAVPTSGLHCALAVLSLSQTAYLGNPALMDAFIFAVPSIFGDCTPNNGTWTGGQLITMRRLPGQILFRHLVSAFVFQGGSGNPEYEIPFTFVDDNRITFVMPNANDAGASPYWDSDDPDYPGAGRVVINFKDAGGVVKMKGFFAYNALQIDGIADPQAVAGGMSVTVRGHALNTVTAAFIQDVDGVVDDIEVTDSFVPNVDDDTTAHYLAPDMTGIENGRLIVAGITELSLGTFEAALRNFSVYSGLEPIIVDVTPLTGPINEDVTIVITGANFQIDPGVDEATEVALIYDGGGPTPDFTVDSDEQITATIAASSLGNHSYDIKVTNGHGNVTWSGGQYKPHGVPTVMSYTPTSGPAAGGTHIVIQVNSSAGCIGAKVGGVPVTGFAVVDATHVEGYTGAHAAGSADVHVINDVGESSAGAGWTYT